jgi:hypothetical protein
LSEFAHKMRRFLIILLSLCFLFPSLLVGQSDGVAVSWPSTEKPLLKLNFAKFQQTGMVNGQGIFTSDVTAQNVSDQGMPRSVFTVFITDAKGVRIGRARLQLSEIAPYRTQKSQLQFSAAGTPAGVMLLAGKTIPLRVISVPAGANFKVDGEDQGTTPKVVDFTIGSHTLDFTKEGYSPGTTPLEVSADELPGGSVTLELGGLSQDMIQLRDGKELLGDVISMSLTEVVVRIDGNDQKFDRSQVKKLILVERVTTESPAVTQPAHTK